MKVRKIKMWEQELSSGSISILLHYSAGFSMLFWCSDCELREFMFQRWLVPNLSLELRALRQTKKRNVERNLALCQYQMLALSYYWAGPCSICYVQKNPIRVELISNQCDFVSKCINNKVHANPMIFFIHMTW